MKTKNIIIAVSLIIFLSSVLTGCDMFKADIFEAEVVETEAPKAESQTDIEALVEKAQAVHKDAQLSLEYKQEKNKLSIKVFVKNPNRKPITSVQSWLSFDPVMLKGKTIETSGSAFSFQAPYDNTFDNINGLVMLGRSNSEPITDESIYVADVVFAPLKTGGTVIEAYDYREDLKGHTSVNVLVEGEPFNVLVKPESPLIIIEN